MADKIYTTVLGDTWDSIAYRLFGDSKAYNSLLELNQEYSDIVIFSAGVKIKYQDKILVKTYEENVPPWRR
jgi:phage tail protein X|nr:MAG TPA_asm: baseplate wedge protein [Caudoviricetes sp.]